MLPTSKGSGYSPLPGTQTSLVPFRTLVRAMIRRPGGYKSMGCLYISVLVCLFVCVFVCVSVCACVSLTSYACFYVSLCMFMAATGAPSVAERSHPTSEVRGISREDPIHKGQQPRGVTPHPRSGAAAKSARL